MIEYIALAILWIAVMGMMWLIGKAGGMVMFTLRIASFIGLIAVTVAVAYGAISF